MHFESVATTTASECDFEATKAAAVSVPATTVTNVSHVAAFRTSECVDHEMRDFPAGI